MGEYVAARVLAVCQHLSRFAEDQRARRWAPHTPRRAAGTRAIVVGTGEVGSGIARALEAIGVEVTGVSRSGGAQAASHPATQPSSHPASHPVSALPELVGHADWLVLAAPLTRESHHMIGRELLARCRGAWLINVARGGLVDEAALVEALDEGRLSGAALDVFEEEPLPADSPLWAHPEVIISPHVAGVTTVEGAVAGFLECLESLERGETPRWKVDPERGY
jgi:phosphoglycerate dehydrogenase-like enzyme